MKDLDHDDEAPDEEQHGRAKENEPQVHVVQAHTVQQIACQRKGNDGLDDGGSHFISVLPLVCYLLPTLISSSKLAFILRLT